MHEQLAAFLAANCLDLDNTVFGDAIEDALGWVEEALTASADGEQAVGNAPDMYRARRALTAFQEHLNRLAQQFSCELVSYERINELTRFGRRRGGEWRR